MTDPAMPTSVQAEPSTSVSIPASFVMDAYRCKEAPPPMLGMSLASYFRVLVGADENYGCKLDVNATQGSQSKSWSCETAP